MIYVPFERGQSISCCSFLVALVLVPIVLLILLALVGPAVGNVFSNITATI